MAQNNKNLQRVWRIRNSVLSDSPTDPSREIAATGTVHVDSGSATVAARFGADRRYLLPGCGQLKRKRKRKWRGQGWT